MSVLQRNYKRAPYENNSYDPAYPIDSSYQWYGWILDGLGFIRFRKSAGCVHWTKSCEEVDGKICVIFFRPAAGKADSEIIGRHLGLEPILCEALRERNLGKCCGKSVQWMRENMEKTEATVDDRMFHDAESRRDEWNRLLPFYQKLMENKEENVLIVSHGDLLGVFHAMWLGMEVEQLNRGELFGMSGGVTLLQENSSGKHVIRYLSDMSYLCGA